MGTLVICCLVLLSIGVFVECGPKTLNKVGDGKMIVINTVLSFGFWISFFVFLTEKLLSVL